MNRNDKDDVEPKDAEPKLGDITKEWTVPFWFLWKNTFKVHAVQLDLPEQFGGMLATAKVTIYKNGKTIHEVEIPWILPKNDFSLALQVYLLSQMPDYEHPEFQPIMEKFALMCEGFSPPGKLYWSDEPLIN